ncbi:MAG: gamma-glutamyl-gamma-aminobutyrate hydrolase family protein [Deltaproteobacteria bacterium]|nr:gamma-glutamyl-gamma-aminobutyrate hydrolase family protein [Deltaproteobacteria bacterium]
MKPKIGVTADFDRTSIPLRPGEPGSYFVREAYIRSLAEAGAIPVILPYLQDRNSIRTVVSSLQGILLTGGDFDIDPQFYGEKPHPKLGKLLRERTHFEMEMARAAMHRDLPILGICGGEQVINVLLGGSLYQDIVSQLPQTHPHQTSKEGKRTFHPVLIQPRTKLSRILGAQPLTVNSTHHQAIKILGKRLKANALAKDGVIEGFESPRHRFLIGIQWHPELLIERDPRHLKLFKAFVQATRSS